MSECCTHLWKPTKGGLGTRQTIYLEKYGCNCRACPLLFNVFMYLCISPVGCFVCVFCLYLSLYFWMVLNWRGARWPSWEQPSRTTTDRQPSLHRLDLLLGSFFIVFFWYNFDICWHMSFEKQSRTTKDRRLSLQKLDSLPDFVYKNLFLYFLNFSAAPAQTANHLCTYWT